MDSNQYIDLQSIKDDLRCDEVQIDLFLGLFNLNKEQLTIQDLIKFVRFLNGEEMQSLGNEILKLEEKNKNLQLKYYSANQYRKGLKTKFQEKLKSKLKEKLGEKKPFVLDNSYIDLDKSISFQGGLFISFNRFKFIIQNCVSNGSNEFLDGVIWQMKYGDKIKSEELSVDFIKGQNFIKNLELVEKKREASRDKLHMCECNEFPKVKSMPQDLL